MNLELFLHKYLIFASELYKDAHFMKQKLVEIEILDLSDHKIASFFSQINKILNYSSKNFIQAPNSSKFLIKLKENSGVMDFAKLLKNQYKNPAISSKFLEFIELFPVFLLTKSKDRIIELYKLDTLMKIEVLASEEENFPLISQENFPFNSSQSNFPLNSQENQNFPLNLAKKHHIIFVLADIHPGFDFKITIDFFKIWSIFNCDLNLIAKFFPKKTLKSLLTLEFPLLSCEVFKLFQIENVFSLYSDNDCFLMNILEDQNFDFFTNVYTNSLQFYNILNFDESFYVFHKFFAIENQGIKKQFSATLAKIDFNFDFFMGINGKYKESLYFFGFFQRKVMFYDSKTLNKTEFFIDSIN